MSLSGPGVFPALMQYPFADDSTQPFWDAAKKGTLACAKCTGCGTFRMPPSPFCFNCQQREVEWVELPGTGTIYSFTIARHALSPELQDAVPYCSAIIELDGTQGAGARMICNVIDCDVDTVKIGDAVEIAFEQLNDDMTVLRFRPTNNDTTNNNTNNTNNTKKK